MIKEQLTELITDPLNIAIFVVILIAGGYVYYKRKSEKNKNERED